MPHKESHEIITEVIHSATLKAFFRSIFIMFPVLRVYFRHCPKRDFIWIISIIVTCTRHANCKYLIYTALGKKFMFLKQGKSN